MSKMESHGHYLEFTRTPQEAETASYRKRVRKLEEDNKAMKLQISLLWNEIEKLKGGAHGE